MGSQVTGGRLLVDNVDITSDAGWAFFESHLAIPPAERPAQISKTSTPDEITTYLARAGFGEITINRGGLWLVCTGLKPGLL